MVRPVAGATREPYPRCPSWRLIVPSLSRASAWSNALLAAGGRDVCRLLLLSWFCWRLYCVAARLLAFFNLPLSLWQCWKLLRRRAAARALMLCVEPAAYGLLDPTRWRRFTPLMW